MEPLPAPANPGWPFPFTPQDWEQTPPAVQAYLRTVRDEVSSSKGVWRPWRPASRQNSRTSHRPPSSD